MGPGGTDLPDGRRGRRLGQPRAQTSFRLLHLCSLGSNSHGWPVRVFVMMGKRMEWYTFSLRKAPVWLGWQGRGRELRQGGHGPHFSVTQRACGLPGVWDHAPLVFPHFPSLLPIAGKITWGEEEGGLRPSCFRWAGPSKKWFSLQMTQRPELSDPGPPSRRSSWRH